MKTNHIVLLFIASLLVNAFLGGMMLSSRVDPDHMPFPKMGKGDMGPPREDMFFKRMTEQAEKLSPEGKAKVSDIVDKYQKLADKNGMVDKRKLFDDIHETMTAPTFDKAKMEKLHKEVNSSESKFKESVGQMMIEIASGLSNPDRIQFFEELFPQHPPGADKDSEGPRGEPPQDGPKDGPHDDEDHGHDKGHDKGDKSREHKSGI